MTDSYSPVIRIPKQQTMDANPSSKSTIRNDFDDFLVSDILYIGDLPNSIRETDIKTLLQHCMPVDMHIRREDNQDDEVGYLRFTNCRYADRAYTLYHGFKFTNGATLQLRMYCDPSLEREALGDILEISNLAPETDDVHRIYDLFRPFGPLQLCISNGEGTAMIQYFSKASTDKAIYQMDGVVLDGNEIKITAESPEQDPDRPTTPGTTPPPLSPTPPMTSPEPQEPEEKQQHPQPEHDSSRDDLQKNQQTHQQTHQQQQQQQQQQQEHHYMQKYDQQQNQQKTPTLTAKSQVDYMNLYVKNMDRQITNSHLQTLFGKFGRIVSARVISHPVTKQSKGYGFVSYSKEDEATRALEEMNGKVVFSKPLYVSYHVPKKGRNEPNNDIKNNNSNGNYNYNNSSKFNGNNVDYHHPLNNQQRPSPSLYTGPESQQNVGNNTETAAAYQQQSYSPSPVFNIPRAQEQSTQQYHPSTTMVEETNPYKNNATIKLPRRKSNVAQIPIAKPSTVFPVISSVTNATHHTPTMTNYPQKPHQPNLPAAWNRIGTTASPTPERRRISIESMTSIMTDTSANIQRQRLTDAVRRHGCCSTERTTDIVDLLMTLTRKERSLCLFNTDFLKAKVELALESLDIFDDDDDDDDDDNGTPSEFRMNGATGQKQLGYEVSSPLPRISKTARNKNPSPVSNAKPTINSNYSNDRHLPVTPPSSSLSISDFNNGRVSAAEIDDFLDSISSLSIHTQKQKLGDIMWNYVKPLAKPLAKHHRVPGFSSKILVDLLDNIPLRELAHGINDPKWLKTKVEEAANTIHRS